MEGKDENGNVDGEKTIKRPILICCGRKEEYVALPRKSGVGRSGLPASFAQKTKHFAGHSKFRER